MRYTFAFFCFLFLKSWLFSQLGPGNLVILRVGDGTNSLTTETRPMTLMEIDQSGSTVSSYNVPTVDSGMNKRLTIRGSAVTEFSINLSADATKVVFPGYVTNAGTSSPHTVSSSTIPRGFGLMDKSGNLNTSTSTTDYNFLTIRGVTSSNGSDFYANGEQDSTSNGGVRYYSSVGGNGSGASINGNSRSIHISSYLASDGNLKHLLISNNASSIESFGNYQNTLPTSSTTNNNFGLVTDGQIIDFLILDADPSVEGADLLYTVSRPALDGDDVLAKYSFNGTSWTFRGSLISDSPSSNRFYAQSLNGYINSFGQVVLFFTGRTTNNSGKVLNTFTDTQARTANISNNGSVFNDVVTSLFTAGNNYSLRGVTWSPSSIVSNPSNSTVCFPSGTSFSVSMTSGSDAVYEYFWQRSSDGGNTWSTITSTTDGSVYSDYNSANLILSTTSSSMNGNSYRCLVRYMSQYWLVSSTATLSVSIVNAFPYSYNVPAGSDCYTSSPLTTGSSNWYKASTMSASLVPQSNRMWVYPSSSETSGKSAILKTIAFDFSNLLNPELKFSWGKSSTSPNANDSIRIVYSTDNWVTSYFLRTAYRVGNTTQWQQNNITLALLGGFPNVSFGFEAYAYGGGEDMAIDDIMVFDSDCPEATGFNSTVSGNSVVLSWNSVTGTDYNVRYRTLPNGAWVSALPAPVTSPLTLILNPSTSYQWQVKTICSGNSYGWPVGTNSFTTSANNPNCLRVTGLNTTLSSCSTAVANWGTSSTADSFIVRLWKYNTNLSIWQIVSIQNVGNVSSVNFNTLVASTQYRWRVIRYCGGTGLNSVLNYFTTGTCRLSGENELTGKCSIAPNPTLQNAVLTFTSPDKTQSTISIQDVTGKIVQTLSHTTEEGENTLWLERQNLPSGVYIITVRNTFQSQSIRWILE